MDGEAPAAGATRSSIVSHIGLPPLGGRLGGVPVVLQGGPSASCWGVTGKTSSWRGVAHADEPVAAIAFATTRRGTTWVKSKLAWGNAVFLEVGRFGDAEAAQFRLTLGSWVWPEVRPGTPAELSARWQGLMPPDGEIQVPVLEWGWSHSTLIPAWGCGDPATEIPRRVTGGTGRLIRVLSTVAASITVDLLVLPRRELRSRRLQNWALNRRSRDTVPEPLRHVLSFGRVGRWPPEVKRGQRYGP